MTEQADQLPSSGTFQRVEVQARLDDVDERLWSLLRHPTLARPLSGKAVQHRFVLTLQDLSQHRMLNYKAEQQCQSARLRRRLISQSSKGQSQAMRHPQQLRIQYAAHVFTVHHFAAVRQPRLNVAQACARAVQNLRLIWMSTRDSGPRPGSDSHYEPPGP